MLTAENLPDIHLLGLFLLPLIAGYAEIHYRLPAIPSRLFKKEPELIFDLPFRSVSGREVPLFLFVKDAHRFPVELQTAQITVVHQLTGQSRSEEIELNDAVEEPFFSHTIPLPATLFPEEGAYRVTAELRYRIARRSRQLRQDNYRGVPHEPFSLYVAGDPLPALPQCYWGDLHIHSSYTDDEIEFGAPLRESVRCAAALGLHFLAITDHSYDLDNAPGDYRRKDPSLSKWQKLWAEADRLQREQPEVVMLPGEEVSAGNCRSRNVHCLVLGSRRFYPGRGDGGGKRRSRRPTTSLDALLSDARHQEELAVLAAAHPFDRPPRSHQWLLNRGYWHPPDLSHPALDYWQILNGRSDDFFREGLRAWQKALLTGRRVGILAGSDAHGNFNCFRQITLPFLKMVKRYDQLLGQTRTGVFSEKPLTRQRLLQQLRKKRVIISNGPCASLQLLQNGRRYQLGDAIQANVPFTVQIAALSTPEFGLLGSLHLFQGRIGDAAEQPRRLEIPLRVYAHQARLEFPEGIPPGYLRLEVRSGPPEQQRFCLTNPIWASGG